MPSAPDLSWSQLNQFIRQHTHDVRNDLNGLDLEASLLADIVPTGEAAESVARIRAQIRRLAGDLRTLAAKFAEPNPTCAEYAGSELFLIWQDQLAALKPAPVVNWSSTLDVEKVNVDAGALAHLFHELLTNAHAFGTGAPLVATAGTADRKIAFELREPKDASVEPSAWGRSPFASTRRGHYGLGLWEMDRTIAASGGEVQRSFASDSMELVTTLRFPVAA